MCNDKEESFGDFDDSEEDDDFVMEAGCEDDEESLIELFLTTRTLKI